MGIQIFSDFKQHMGKLVQINHRKLAQKLISHYEEIKKEKQRNDYLKNKKIRNRFDSPRLAQTFKKNDSKKTGNEQLQKLHKPRANN